MYNYDDKLRNDVRGTTRKFKEIDAARILDVEKYGILPIGTDEIFVLVKDSNTFYISNYGRAVNFTDKPRLVNGFTENKKLIYNVPIWKDGEFELTERYVDYLVVDTFMASNNQYIWHMGNNLDDNYYLNLYPVNWKEHREIRRYIKNGGIDTPETIDKIIKDTMYKPTVLGIGYWGTREVDTRHWTYITWLNMLERCYSEPFHDNQPWYKGCTVDKEWHCYVNFKAWAEENIYTVDGERIDLDKDILFKGNTCYSKDTCVFVPQSINRLIGGHNKNRRGDLPMGVIPYVDYGKYIARIKENDSVIILGYFDTPEEAFNCYKQHREQHIKDAANKYRKILPDRLYNALMQWEVEIDD